MTIELFEFQREDVTYLESQKAALIANDMGTGKTYEAIARDELLRKKSLADQVVSRGPFLGHTLVVAPLTVLQDVWQSHFEDLTSHKVVCVDPKDRYGSWNAFLKTKADVFLVHWEALRLMPELAQQAWLHVIADECHRAKSRTAQQTKALKKIPATWKTAMSGTPVINRPDELWSVLNWLYPQRYRSYWKFFNRYVDYTVENHRGRVFRKINGPKNVIQLQEEIKPFFVRRRKKDVLKDLPDKYYTEVRVSLTPEQFRVYEQMRKNMVAWIGAQQDDLLAAPVVIAQLTRLQQFSCAYAELDEKGRVRLHEPSSKIDALMELLDEAEGEQFVVFSRFRQLINLVEQRLLGAGVSLVTLTGGTPQEERAGIVSRFQDGKARVFAGTIAAGGVGITLHAASRVVFLDRDWSPANNSQAEDRLHRIGQKNAVQVIDVIAKKTVDLGRMQRLELKKEWIRQILGDPKEEMNARQ